MGLSIRVFIVEDDDTIKRLPLARYERLLRRDPDERLSKYAGKRVRYALIVVDLVNRKPIEVVRDEYAYLVPERKPPSLKFATGRQAKLWILLLTRIR